jgi:hypothetical protein
MLSRRCNGSVRLLERLSKTVAGLLSDPVIPRDFRSSKNQISPDKQEDGNRIKYVKVDTVTGEPVDDEDIVKGYDIGSGRCLEITEDELEAIAVQGTHTIEIDQFVPKDEIYTGPFPIISRPMGMPGGRPSR